MINFIKLGKSFISDCSNYEVVVWDNTSFIDGLCSEHDVRSNDCILSPFDEKMSKILADKLLKKDMKELKLRENYGFKDPIFVEDLREFLRDLPQDAKVVVSCHLYGRRYIDEISDNRTVLYLFHSDDENDFTVQNFLDSLSCIDDGRQFKEEINIQDAHNMDGLVWFKYDEDENILYAMV